MAITPSDFSLSIQPTTIKTVVGGEEKLSIFTSNLNNTDACYNLSIILTLPDGVSFISATVPPTSITAGPSGSIIVSFTNIKDLAHNEIDYLFNVVLKSDAVFRQSGLPVPFDIPINYVNVDASVDTLPRGNEDIGNQVITKVLNASFLPLRYNINKHAPAKMPKGAGLILPDISPMWVYEYTLVVENNSESSSLVNIVDELPNGVRYLGNVNALGPNAVLLLNPTVYNPSVGQDYYVLDWGSVMLSPNSVNRITFEVAIWDNYTVNGIENSGDTIVHGTMLTNTAKLDGVSGLVVDTTNTATMDATIDKFVDTQIIDVGEILFYELQYKINQYDNVNNFVITDTLSNGQSYNVGSASITPTSVTENLDGTTTIVWELGNILVGDKDTITFSSTILANYINGDPVVSDDHLPNSVISNGTNNVSGIDTPDSSKSNTFIDTPIVSKRVVDYYYKDGTLKPYDIASPGDYVEFEITYDSTFIQASALDVFLDEFAPLNMGPLNGIHVTYTGNLPGPFTPYTISPNGARLNLGIVPGRSIFIATFRVPVRDTVFIGTKNNLAKLSAQNTLDRNYSDRDQVDVFFGAPNITFSKTLAPGGLLIPGSTYVYTITISNMQDSTGLVTDAFNMSLTDVIPTGLTYTGVYSVTGTGSYNAPSFTGQNINMLINKLAPNQSLVFKYNVTVDIGVAAGITLTNNASLTRPYSQADSSFQYPGSPFRARVSRQVVMTSVSKTSSVTADALGQDFNYIVTVKIPKGTTAYSPQIIDTLPVGVSYIGPATSQVVPNLPVGVIPTVVGQVITFPPHADITAIGADALLVYSFVCRVISATHLPPYQEPKQNNVQERWLLAPNGQSLTLSASSTLTATTPNLTLLKEQKNFTHGGPFTTDQLILNNDEELHYRLTVTSNGASTAYSTELTDVLNSNLQFDGIVLPPTKGTISITGSPGSQRIVWNIPSLLVGETTSVVFAVKPYFQGAAISMQNSFNGIYSSYTTNGTTYAVNSNNVVTLAPNLGFYKSFSKRTANVGETIRYYIHLIIPPGIVAYNVNIKDILPDGEKYAGNAKRNNFTVNPLVLGQEVIFNTEYMIGPFSETTEILYSFDAIITEGPEPNNIETHTNNAQLEWDVSPSGEPADPIISKINITITNKPPTRGIVVEELLEE